MRRLKLSIAEYYNRLLSFTKGNGFIWAVSVLAQGANAIDLYKKLCSQWKDLNAITGKYFLFVVASAENNSGADIIVVPEDEGQYDNYIYFLPDDSNSEQVDSVIKAWQEAREKSVEHTFYNQTEATNSLSNVLGIELPNSPCLVFTPLRRVREHITVPIKDGANDLSGYFAGLLKKINPILKKWEADSRCEVYLSEIESIIRASEVH